jgi:hypothetical protein
MRRGLREPVDDDADLALVLEGNAVVTAISPVVIPASVRGSLRAKNTER